MKKMLIKVMLRLCSCLLMVMGMQSVHAAGLIVNELSNGTSGSKEFFELLVVGDAGAPLTAVNLDGWIIDDNNGEWSGTGIGAGFLKFNATACPALAAVPPGAIIVVYNGTSPATKNDAIVAADDFDDTAPADSVYIIPNTSACIDGYNNPAYTGAIGADNWGKISLRNGGDVGQVRDPIGALFHGFSYGDVGNTVTPVNGFDINDGNTPGSQQHYSFACGDWFDNANFTAAGAASDSPGTANDPDNTILISNIKAGIFDYTNLANPANCTVLASLTLNKLVDNNNGGTAVIADFPLFANGTAFTAGTAQAVNVGTYALTETNLAGYTASDYSCVINGGAAIVGNDVTLALGDIADCTITNTDNPTNITLVNTVTNDNGGTAVPTDFTLRLNGGIYDGTIAYNSGVTLPIMPGVTYTVSEDSLVGYTQDSLLCIDDSDGVTLVAHPVVPALGQSITCTVNDNDNGAELTIIKQVINDHSGIATIADFGLMTDAGTLTFGVPTGTGTATDPFEYISTTITGLTAGTYTLVENDLADYTEGSWDCVDTAGVVASIFNAGSVTLANGENAICSISNDDQAITLPMPESIPTLPRPILMVLLLLMMIQGGFIARRHRGR